MGLEHVQEFTPDYSPQSQPLVDAMRDVLEELRLFDYVQPKIFPKIRIPSLVRCDRSGFYEYHSFHSITALCACADLSVTTDPLNIYDLACGSGVCGAIAAASRFPRKTTVTCVDKEKMVDPSVQEVFGDFNVAGALNRVVVANLANADLTTDSHACIWLANRPCMPGQELIMRKSVTTGRAGSMGRAPGRSWLK